MIVYEIEEVVRHGEDRMRERHYAGITLVPNQGQEQIDGVEI